jgi:hypothetical protein
MGISKFKNLVDAERALWEFYPDDAYFKRVRGLFELAEHLLDGKDERGIKKYRSLEERAAWLEKKQ